MGRSNADRLCEHCAERSRCEQPCEQIERLLPEDETGETWREQQWEFSKQDPRRQAAWGLTDDADLHRLFWYSWDRMTPRQREALMLRNREHMSFREIAKKMRISKPAAFKLYRRAFRGLTNSPHMGTCSSER